MHALFPFVAVHTGGPLAGKGCDLMQRLKVFVLQLAPLQAVPAQVVLALSMHVPSLVQQSWPGWQVSTHFFSVAP
jgi:hypothetical protein